MIPHYRARPLRSSSARPHRSTRLPPGWISPLSNTCPSSYILVEYLALGALPPLLSTLERSDAQGRACARHIAPPAHSRPGRHLCLPAPIRQQEPHRDSACREGQSPVTPYQKDHDGGSRVQAELGVQHIPCNCRRSRRHRCRLTQPCTIAARTTEHIIKIQHLAIPIHQLHLRRSLHRARV